MSDIRTSFGIHSSGIGVISMDDPTFVRAETIMITYHDRAAFVLLEQKLHHLGEVPHGVMQTFCENPGVMLSATRVDGSLLELRSNLVIS